MLPGEGNYVGQASFTPKMSGKASIYRLVSVVCLWNKANLSDMPIDFRPVRSSKPLGLSYLFGRVVVDEYPTALTCPISLQVLHPKGKKLVGK